MRADAASRTARPAGPSAHGLPNVKAVPSISPFVSGCSTTGSPRIRPSDERRQSQHSQAAHDEDVVAARLAADGAHRRRNHPVLPRPAGADGRHAHDADAVDLVGAGPGSLALPRHHRDAVARRDERAAEAPQVRLAAAQHGVERLREEEDARQRGRASVALSGAPSRGALGGEAAAALAPALDAPPGLDDHVDRLALALVPDAYEELADEPEADECHPGEEQQRAEEEQGTAADRLVEDDLHDREVGEDRRPGRAEAQAQETEQVRRARAVGGEELDGEEVEEDTCRPADAVLARPARARPVVHRHLREASPRSTTPPPG